MRDCERVSAVGCSGYLRPDTSVLGLHRFPPFNKMNDVSLWQWKNRTWSSLARDRVWRLEVGVLRRQLEQGPLKTRRPGKFFMCIADCRDVLSQKSLHFGNELPPRSGSIRIPVQS